MHDSRPATVLVVRVEHRRQRAAVDQDHCHLRADGKHRSMCTPPTLIISPVVSVAVVFFKRHLFQVSHDIHNISVR